MRARRPPLDRKIVGLGALALLAAGGVLGARCMAAPARDPLTDEIAHWSAEVARDSAVGGEGASIRALATPALRQAANAVGHGRRALALFRLASVRTLLAAQRYTREHPAADRSLDALEAEWKRIGPVLGDALRAPSPAALADVHPAAVRAIAEAALPQVRAYYDASLDYGRATSPDAGLFYVGQAVAQEQFVAWCRTLGEREAGSPPAFRSIAGEIDALQGELLAAYRPPASIDRHPEFIAASAALKEARELDDAGLWRGALLRYLQAAVRLQPLRPDPPEFDPVATSRGLHAFETRLARAGLDHSVGQLFAELAEADLEDTSSGSTHATAAAVVAQVAPRYFAALAPAPPAPRRGTPEVTVTLVRWPYT